MTLTELKSLLDDARDSASRLRALSRRAEESRQVYQRLTAAYGKERVQSSPVYENPALKAIIFQERQAEEHAHELAEAIARIDQGKTLIARLPACEERELLTDFFVMCWSKEKICKLHNIVNERTAGRRIHRATELLFRQLSK